MSRRGCLVAGGIGDPCGADIDADVAGGGGGGSDDECIGRAAAGEEAFAAVADRHLAGIKAGDGF